MNTCNLLMTILVDGGENIIDISFHGAILLPHLISINHFHGFARADGQVNEGNFRHAIAKDRIFAPDVVEEWEISYE
jgi:hypothetical protein